MVTSSSSSGSSSVGQETVGGRNSVDVVGGGGGPVNLGRNRIPPPPLLYNNNDDDDGSNNNNNNSNNGPVYPWVLKVRCLTKSGNQAGIRIQVYPNMSSENLGRCISQAASSYNSMPPETIVGLFGDHDSIFYSLEHILQSSDSERVVYSIMRPIPRETPKVEPSYWPTRVEAVLVLVAIVAVVVFYRGTDVMALIQRTMTAVVSMVGRAFYLIFDMPLRELYRYGPHMVGGWEGIDLPDICTRITYHGDRMFWMRNLSDCQTIYNNKEEAFVRVLRPLLYIVLLVGTFLTIRHLIAVYAENKRDRTDRAVLETYHAFSTLVKLANRQMDRQMGGRRY